MIFAFGDAELDEELFELRFRGQTARVAPKVIETLAYLLQNRSRTVTKDELLEAVWKGIVVSDGALSQTVMLARKAVGDIGAKQTIIKTVRGRGFRFVASVTERPADAPRAPDPEALREPPLLGREAEVVRLQAALAQVEQGHGRFALVAGEAGIGKTVLLEHFAKLAHDRGAEILWGRGWEDGGAPAFWPWIQLLRSLVARRGLRSIESQLGAAASDVLTLLPEHALPSGARASSPEHMPHGDHERFRVFDAMARLLYGHCDAPEADGGRRAIVLLFDDAHALDGPSLQLLRFLGQDIASHGLLVVFAYRDTDRPETLAGLGPIENGEHILLRGFAEGDSARFVQLVRGEQTSERVQRLLHQLSQGHPFLLSELCRLSDEEALESSQLSALHVFRVPERIARAVRRRVASLPQRTLDVLSVASAFRLEFALPHLAAVCEAPELAIIECLGPALDTRVLVPVPAAPSGRMRFSHTLVRETIYSDLGPARRVELHLRIARVLESSQTRSLHELAHHYYLAAPLGVSMQAVRYAELAAQAAENARAYETAGALYDQAVLLLSESAAEDPKLYELSLASGHAFLQARNMERAIARYVRAAQAARTNANWIGFGYAVGGYAFARRGVAHKDVRFLELLREALARLPPGDSPIRAVLGAFAPLALDSLGPIEQRRQTTCDAVSMARRIADPHALLLSLLAQRWLLAGAVPPTDTLAIDDELMRLARQLEDPDVLLEAYFWQIPDRLVLGQFEAAAADIQAYGRCAEACRNQLHRYWAAVMVSMQAGWSGQFARAETLAAEALVLGRRIEEPLAEIVHAAQRWTIRAERGVVEAFPEHLMAALPIDPSHACFAFWRVRRDAGDIEDARASLQALAREQFDSVPHDFARLAVLANCAFVTTALREVGAARRLYELLMPERELIAIGTGPFILLGPVSRFLALLAELLGDTGRARAHFEDALQRCADLGARPCSAQIQLEYGRMLLRSRAPRGAGRRLLEQAARQASELGMERVRSEAAQLLG